MWQRRQDHLESKGVTMGRQKAGPVPRGSRHDSLSQDQETNTTRTRLAVSRPGERGVIASLGTEDSQECMVRQSMKVEPTTLVCALPPIEDDQTSFQISAPLAITRISFWLKTLPPEVTDRPWIRTPRYSSGPWLEHNG